MANRRLAADDIQPNAFAFTAENEAWVAREVQKYPPGRQMSAVIPLLWRAQEQAGGWLPQKAIEAVADRLGMAYIRVLEVATFYTMFNLEPVGRYLVQLCGTVPCHVKGAIELKETLRRRVGEERHVTADGTFSWLEVECLGACCNAPMVQINADYYEDLAPQILETILDDLAAGREVKPGPQQGRVSSEPAGTRTTLTDESLFDGSVVGSWRRRFEEVAVTTAPEQRAAVEAKVAVQTAPGEPKPAKPDSGRAIESEVADTPAKRAKEGEPPIGRARREGAADPATTSVVGGTEVPDKVPGPQSDKSYQATPVKPEEGRLVADAPTTPVAGTPPSDGATHGTGSERPGAPEPDQKS
jgi:NADH-quinone oxidoreductase subunit E